MNRFLWLIVMLALMVSGAACGMESRQDQLLDTLGDWECTEFYTSGGFQDYTDFGKYNVSGEAVAKSACFAPISEADIETLNGFWDDFEGWIDSIGRSDPDNEVVVNYRFDRALADPEDRFYIYEDLEIYSKYGCYDVWFYDSQSGVLYYFHNNI